MRVTKKRIKEDIKIMFDHIEKGNYDKADQVGGSLITDLFEQKQYSDIIKLYEDGDVGFGEKQYFELAYSFKEVGNLESAQIFYSNCLKSNKNNTSVLNNLAIIEEDLINIETAYKLISKGYELDKKDKIIKKNYKRISSKINDIKQEDISFRSAKDLLSKETKRAFDKLVGFINNAKKDSTYNSYELSIPQRKFAKLIGVNEERAASLKEQRLDRYYLMRTGKRGEYNSTIYKINPYIEVFIDKIKPLEIPQKRSLGIDNITSDNLLGIGFPDYMKKIDKTSKTFKDILKRDFSELCLNYIMKNYKSTIILSGSFVELLFTYYCNKKRIKDIIYINNRSKKIKKKVNDATLIDFIEYFKLNDMFSKNIIAISNISRLYRNLIHPGLELKNSETLDESKIQICFHSVLEISKEIL